MTAAYVDCQRCGAIVVMSRWPSHVAAHTTGELATLSVTECLHINAIAHSLKHDLMPEDFGSDPSLPTHAKESHASLQSPPSRQNDRTPRR